MKSKKKKISVSTIVIYAMVSIFVLFCVLPFILVISASFTSEEAIVENGLRFWPQDFTFDAYKYIFKYPEDIVNAYGVTIFVTVVGTILNMLFTIWIAYPLSRMKFRWRRQMAFYLYFTMLFSGGLVPNYLLIKNGLHIYDTIWALILPLIIVPGNVFLLRVFFQSVPESLYESARMDGASEFQMLYKIAIPLSKPGLVTIMFFIILMYWNDAYTALIYTEDVALTPLQIMLSRLVNYVQYIKQSEMVGGLVAGGGTLPENSLMFAMCVVATGPMLIVFSFFQKHFVRGLTAGAVKG